MKNFNKGIDKFNKCVQQFADSMDQLSQDLDEKPKKSNHLKDKKNIEKLVGKSKKSIGLWSKPNNPTKNLVNIWSDESKEKMKIRKKPKSQSDMDKIWGKKERDRIW